MSRRLEDLYRDLEHTHDTPARDRILDAILDHPDYQPTKATP